MPIIIILRVLVLDGVFGERYEGEEMGGEEFGESCVVDMEAERMGQWGCGLDNETLLGRNQEKRFAKLVRVQKMNQDLQSPNPALSIHRLHEPTYLSPILSLSSPLPTSPHSHRLRLPPMPVMAILRFSQVRCVPAS